MLPIWQLARVAAKIAVCGLVLQQRHVIEIDGTLLYAGILVTLSKQGVLVFLAITNGTLLMLLHLV